MKWRRVDVTQHVPTGEETMVVATAKIESFDRFWNVFSTKGAEKRKQHGCKGAHVFQDPKERDRLWAIFDWDEAGWQNFTSDPEVPAIFQEAGFTQGPPKSAEFLRENYA
jgi:quinol monooxygenase YgiN